MLTFCRTTSTRVIIKVLRQTMTKTGGHQVPISSTLEERIDKEQSTGIDLAGKESRTV